MNYSDYFTSEPTPDPLWEFAHSYYETTEAYDKLVCTGPIKEGIVYPATSYELGLINRNAAKVLKDLHERVAILGYGPDQLKLAMKNYFRK